MGVDRGNAEERPRHPVTISRGYWMGRYEVTQKQFESVMQTKPSKFTNAGPNAPADSVTWLEAKEFVKRLNQKAGSSAYALPTEAQWEYACWAGTPSFNENLLVVLGWHHANSGQSTQPVGKLRPNAWGLHDMLGNVWEWCEDWYAGKHDTSKASDPTGPATGNLRVARGGAWDSHDKKPDMSAFTFRSAIASPNYGVKIISPTVRFAQSPEMRADNVGFRIVVIP